MTTPRCLLAGSAALAVAFSPHAADAQGTIKRPGDHPHYGFEAEPHLAVTYEGGFGPGFRGTIAIWDYGFISSINNSVGIGFGADWLFYGENCHGGPGPTRICERVGDVLVPVVIQWNFWLHRKFSVFGEPGVVFHFQRGRGDNLEFDPFTIYGGGRFHFSDSVALTLRLGAPRLFKRDNTITIGVSFLL
jgi:hypothetical protein